MLPPFPESSQMNEWGVFIFDEIREVGFFKIFNISGNFGSQQKYASKTTELGKQNKPKQQQWNYQSALLEALVEFISIYCIIGG